MTTRARDGRGGGISVWTGEGIEGRTARALAARLRQTMPEAEFQALCLFSAESNAMMQAMKTATKKFDLSRLKMYPCVVPDRGISDQTMDAALAAMRALVEQNRAPEPKPAKKPWWKVW